MLRSTTGVVGMVSLCVLFLPPLVQLLLYRGVVAIGAAAAELFGTRSLLRLLRGTQQALAIAFALLVKFACMALGAVGIANMWLAIFADVGVMVLAVLNAIRALFVHRL